MGKPYKETFTLEERTVEAQKMIEKYPDRIPVVVERAPSAGVPEMEKKKFLVPAEMTVGQFVHHIGHRITLKSGEALFLFVDGVLPETGAMIGDVHAAHADEDGFLYVVYSGEKTFGAVLPDIIA